jgi:hypothetical protein
MLQPILTKNIEDTTEYIIRLYNKHNVLQWFNKKQKAIFVIEAVILQRQDKYLAWNVILDGKKYRMICRNKEKINKYDFFDCSTPKPVYYGSTDTFYTDKNIIQYPFCFYRT